MGSSYNAEKQTRMKMIKVWIACLGSFLLSMAGGLILLLWEIKYHPSNSQLWMVPCGLIMFVTPALACFAAFLSDTLTQRASLDHPTTFIIQPTAFSQLSSPRHPSQHV
ncbi:hypothetical protein CTI12_AA025000 [Artemisia annua]|uniref:Uncharacterized protein n=1 Tax=Artemisia annua TaxID=35608 RepID=A0A2U1L3W0_ARTAN|nr:hypothetical protein CTI12_AA533470 [Artemisia annua]PWA97832.1 hypothetical protein CTI12_AA025000 [Artemisia annua]